MKLDTNEEHRRHSKLSDLFLLLLCVGLLGVFLAIAYRDGKKQGRLECHHEMARIKAELDIAKYNVDDIKGSALFEKSPYLKGGAKK